MPLLLPYMFEQQVLLNMFSNTARKQVLNTNTSSLLLPVPNTGASEFLYCRFLLVTWFAHYFILTGEKNRM